LKTFFILKYIKIIFFFNDITYQNNLNTLKKNINLKQKITKILKHFKKKKKQVRSFKKEELRIQSLLGLVFDSLTLIQLLT